jgi:tetratricopeptide (TPR) repeat protein
LRLTQDLADTVEEGGTRNPKARDLFWLSRQSTLRITHENMEHGLAQLNEAIQLDPNYAIAWSERSQVKLDLYTIGPGDQRQLLESARRDAQHAIDLAPRLATGYYAYGYILYSAYLDFRGAQQAYAKAAELEPDEPGGIAIRSKFDAVMGHGAEALAAAQRAIDLDPLNSFSYHNAAATAYFAGHFAQSLSYAEQAIKLGNDLALEWRCKAATAQHLYQEALRVCADAPAGVKEAYLAISLQALHRPDDAREQLEELMKRYGDSAAYQYVEIYAQWGEKKLALQWLEKAFELKDGDLICLRSSPLLDSIRQDARFKAVLSKMNFPP